MKCQNCTKIQECDKSHHFKCIDFDLYGTKPSKPRKSKGLCGGCRNDYYNNKYRDKGCMLYKGAKVVLKSYPNGLNDRPPWRLKYKLSCFIRRW